MNSIWTARRSTADRKISGVAGGIARTWNVDPVLVRVGFAVLALSGGIGLVLYLAGWLMMPEEGKQTSYLDDAIPQTRGWSRELRTGLIVLACLIGVAALSWLVPFSFSAAVVMAAVWYFGYYRPRRQAERAAATAAEAPRLQFARFTGEPTPFTEAAEAWQQRIAEYERMEAARAATGSWAAYSPGGWPAATAASVPAQPPAQAPAAAAVPTPDPERAAFLAHPDPVGLYSDPPPDDSAVRRAEERRALRRRSARRLGLASLVVIGLTMSGLAAVSALGVAVPTSAYFGAALLLVGVTMLLGARFGRPRGAVPAAILLSGAMAFSLVHERVPAVAGVMDARSTPYVQAAAMPEVEQLGIGARTVDLSRLELDRPQTYTAHLRFGSLTVRLPRNVRTVVEYDVGDGAVKLPGQQESWDSNLSGTIPAATNVPGPTLTLHLKVDEGRLEVRQ